MKVTIIVNKTADGKYNAKFEASTLNSSERIKRAETPKEITDYAEKLINDADEAGLIAVK